MRSRSAGRRASPEVCARTWHRTAPIELAFDSRVSGDPAHVEVARAQRFVDLPGLVAMVGHAGSRATLAAAPVYNDAGIPQVAPTSTSRLLASATHEDPSPSKGLGLLSSSSHAH